jgi:hypothetical protein
VYNETTFQYRKKVSLCNIVYKVVVYQLIVKHNRVQLSICHQESFTNIIDTHVNTLLYITNSRETVEYRKVSKQRDREK